MHTSSTSFMSASTKPAVFRPSKNERSLVTSEENSATRSRWPTFAATMPKARVRTYDPIEPAVKKQLIMGIYIGEAAA